MIGLGSTVGNYHVVKKLGAGAMGAVYLAEHPTIGKRVALKVIHADLAENEEMLSRFFNEARAVTQIGHQHIVEVMDFGQSPDGDNFIVMELLEGVSLGDVLKETPVLDIKRAVHIALQMAEGLAASHARGIVHRDLKPDNVFLLKRGSDENFVKILDFGLAKLTQGGGALSHKTRAGSVLGTPHYMAPEQCEGKPDIDHRVDVYALGCLMYQMVCGRVPFPGDGFGEVLVKHLREPPVLPTKLNPLVPRPVETIILHALAKRKEFRFQSMKDLARALRDPDEYVRELSGEQPLSPSTMEMQVPEQLRAMAAAAAAAQVPHRPSGPVAKAGDASPTQLDELPEEVQAALAAAAPPPVVAPSPGPQQQATMMLDAAALGLPALPEAPAAPGRGIAPTPPAYRTQVATRGPKPASSHTGRNVALIAVGIGSVLVLGGGALFVQKNRATPGHGGEKVVALAAAPAPAAAPSVKALPTGPKKIVIDSEPPGADVYVGARVIGSTPTSLDLAEGQTVGIRVHKQGYVDIERALSIADPDDVTLKLRALLPGQVGSAPPALIGSASPALIGSSPDPSPSNDPRVAKPGDGKGKKKGGGSSERGQDGDDILVPSFE